MLKKKLFCVNLIILLVMLLSTTCFAANYTIDLYEGETSETIESPDTTYSITDTSIATMNATIGAGMVTVYKAGDQDLDSARYTFTAGNNNSYTISGNGVYLYLGNQNNNRVNSTSSRNINLVTSGNGFYIRYGTNNYTARFLKYSNNAFTSATGTNGNRTMYLYEKDPAGVGDGNGIPGYNRVTSVTNGGQYLIVYPSGNNYYILYPSTSNYTKTLTAVQEGEPSTYSFTGVQSGTTTATIGSDNYTINVYRRPDGVSLDEEIVVQRGSTYTIQTNIQGLTYTSLDTNIATVNSAGVVTGVAQGTTKIKAVAPDGTMYLIPTTVYNNVYTTTITIEADAHSNAYYTDTYSTLHSAGKNEVITFRQPSGIYKVFNIYGVPDDGYAIVEMTGYMTALTEDTPGEVRSGIGSSFLARHFNNVGKEKMASHIENVLALGGEGVNGYTREASNSNNYTGGFTIKSEKLPTLSSSIYSVNGVPYQSGMTIKEGDVVIYEVNVLKDEMGEYLAIEDGTITPSLTGTTYLGTSPNGNTYPNNIEIDPGYTYNTNYYFSYTVPANTTGTVNNTFTLDYTTYSTANIHTSNGGNNLSYKTDRTLSSSNQFTVTTPEYHFTFDNTVYGNAGDQEKYFKYKVEIDCNSGETFTITGQDSSVTYGGQTISTSNTYTAGNQNYVYLKHGQSVTIDIVSNQGVNYAGRTITITQMGDDDYQTKVDGVEKVVAGPLTIVDNMATVHYTNYKEIAPNTGGSNYYIIPYVLIITMTIMGITFIKTRKREV